MSSSLSRFSGWRLRSLSLGEGLTDSTGAPGWHPRCWCVGSRAAPAFFFLALCAVELPGRSRPAPGVVDLRRGTQCRALSPDFPAGRLRSLSLGEGLTDFDRRAGMAPALLVCWIAGGAGFFLFSVVAVELPGRSRPAPGVVDLRRGTQCRALSPDFPAGACGLYPLARG